MKSLFVVAIMLLAGCSTADDPPEVAPFFVASTAKSLVELQGCFSAAQERAGQDIVYVPKNSGGTYSAKTAGHNLWTVDVRDEGQIRFVELRPINKPYGDYVSQQIKSCV
jgi:hypothetical protein